jgi:hypothetical protein
MVRPFRRPLSRRALVLAGLAAFAAAGLLVLAVGGLVIPRVVRQALEERLQARLAVPVRIERVHLNLFTARGRLADVRIGGLGGGPPILALAALDFQLSYRSLLDGEIVLRYLAFDRPRVFVERTGPDSVNVLQALRPAEGGGAAAGVTIEHVSLRGGVVSFVDRTQSPAFERTFTDVALEAGPLSSLPEFRFTPAWFEARIGIGRGALTVAGTTAPFPRPDGLELVARLDGIEPGLLTGYLPLRARIDLRGSRVDGEIRYRLAYRGNELLEHGLTARVETGPVRFLPPDDDTPLVGFASLAGEDIQVDFRDNRVRLGDLLVREPHVRLVREPTGLNLAALLALDPAPAASSTEPRRPVSVVVGRARLEGGLLEFADRTTSPAVTTALRDVGVRLEEVSFGPSSRHGRLEAEARVENGQVRLDGTVEGGTLASRLHVRATGLPLAPLRPYVEPALRGVTVAGGRLEGALQVALAPRAGEGAWLEVTGGTLGARDVALALPSAQRPALVSRRVTLDVARLRLGPAFEAEIARARLAGVTLSVTRGRDGRLDLQRVWTAAGPESAAPATSSPPSPPGRRFAIRRLEVTDGRLEFADAGFDPVFRETLRDLTVEMRPGEHPDRMAVRLRGRLGEEASLEAEGWATPFAAALRAEGKGIVQGYGLSTLNPYLAPYVGRVEQGRLSAEVAGTYGDGRYTADPRITIRHLRLGNGTDPGLREDLGIPVELALSLLEGPGGEIDLRVPVSGGAGGTELELRHVILTVLRNGLVKTLAAPFKMFGTLLTRGDRIGEVRINPIEFEPGSLVPDDQASARLAGVIEFLKDRPRLGLALRGVAAPGDVDGLKRERLRQALAKTPAVPDAPLVAVYRGAGGGAGGHVPPAAEMERFLLERTRVTEDDLRTLAEQRARVIRETLIRHGIEPGRLSLARADRAASAEAGAGRVEFELTS